MYERTCERGKYDEIILCKYDGMIDLATLITAPQKRRENSPILTGAAADVRRPLRVSLRGSVR
jgi:hypothetical protein